MNYLYKYVVRLYKTENLFIELESDGYNKAFKNYFKECVFHTRSEAIQYARSKIKEDPSLEFEIYECGNSNGWINDIIPVQDFGTK